MNTIFMHFCYHRINFRFIFQGGLGMGERDYYLENDDKTKEIRDAYQKHIVKMFRLAGSDEQTPVPQ